MKKVITAVVACVILALMALGYWQASQREHTNTHEMPDTKGVIFNHLGDSYYWDIPFSEDYFIPLPCIVQDKSGAWHLFSSARVHGGNTYVAPNGAKFKIQGDINQAHHNRLVELGADNGKDYRPLDLSFTKDALGIFIAALVVMLLVFNVRNWYKKHGMKAPRKGTAFIEVCVDFVYGDTIRPIMGKEAPKYAPYLLTCFFFILTMNLLGLVVIFPGGANLTGNLAVTLFLALCTFLVTNFTGTREYWKEIFWPDVPCGAQVPCAAHASDRAFRHLHQAVGPDDSSLLPICLAATWWSSSSRCSSSSSAQCLASLPVQAPRCSRWPCRSSCCFSTPW
jgi:F-type H+-transporting ATPase subunit a